jgi:hypothetical protein
MSGLLRRSSSWGATAFGVKASSGACEWRMRPVYVLWDRCSPVSRRRPQTEMRAGPRLLAAPVFRLYAA